MKNALLVTSLALLAACNSSPPVPGAHPQLILHGGVIYTQDGGQIVEAIALQDGRVLAVGTDDDIRKLASRRTEQIDLEGRAVYPGFADAHAHLVGIGLAAVRLDLVGTSSFEEVVRLAQERNASLAPGDWLEGRGWDQNDWAVKEFPHHAALSRAIPNRPVVLKRVDGHALLANAAAMKLAGVDRETDSPEGGLILKDDLGEPTGVFVDTAQGLFRDVRPEPSDAMVGSAIQAATATLHRQGITALHDAGIGAGELAVLKGLADDGALRLRLHEMLSGSNEALLSRHFNSGPVSDYSGDGTLAIRSVKLYADGALGSRGAALLEPYSDDEHNHGLTITSREAMQRVSERALEAGFQVCTHAIGDRGVRMTLDAYADAFKLSNEPDPRFRVEHAQVVNEDDFARFARLGVIPSMQAQHQTSDMPWAEDRVGAKRIRGAYAWRRFLDLGCIVPGGSDAPVERLDTVAQFAAAVTRQTLDGDPEGGWYPDQVMTRQEALDMLTVWPAHAAFREHDLGRLAPGYRADLVVFDGDLMRTRSGELESCSPALTVFAGEVVWSAD